MEEDYSLPPLTTVAAQKQLQLMGYYGGEIDGDDGEITQSAVDAAIAAGIPADMVRLLDWIEARDV